MIFDFFNLFVFSKHFSQYHLHAMKIEIKEIWKHSLSFQNLPPPPPPPPPPPTLRPVVKARATMCVPGCTTSSSCLVTCPACRTLCLAPQPPLPGIAAVRLGSQRPSSIYGTFFFFCTIIVCLFKVIFIMFLYPFRFCLLSL